MSNTSTAKFIFTVKVKLWSPELSIAEGFFSFHAGHRPGQGRKTSISREAHGPSWWGTFEQKLINHNSPSTRFAILLRLKDGPALRLAQYQPMLRVRRFDIRRPEVKACGNTHIHTAESRVGKAIEVHERNPFLSIRSDRSMHGRWLKLRWYPLVNSEGKDWFPYELINFIWFRIHLGNDPIPRTSYILEGNGMGKGPGKVFGFLFPTYLYRWM